MNQPTPDPTADRHVRHALGRLNAASTDRRRLIEAAATEYLSQVHRHRLPAGYSQPIADDRQNRADAFHMRRGDQLAQLLGLAARPDDPHLPVVAQAVLTELDAPVRQLTEYATLTGQPEAVALLHLTTPLTADSGDGDDITLGLHWIARRLEIVRPHGEMTPAARRALADRAGIDRHGFGNPASHALTEALLQHLPTPTAGINRADYAATIPTTGAAR
ncbi:hypothetical protein ACFXHD_09755 [Streptomyces hydrogenans]|uniref:hypothetical protein n=1 Tax=Streptomyces hydrogenans TaxID=1873719 RepID=UPI0036BC650A